MSVELTTQELSALIEEIYAAATTAVWDKVLDRIVGITESSKAFFFLQEIEAPLNFKVHLQANFKFPKQALLAYQNNPYSDPFYEVAKDLPEGEAIRFNDYIDISQHKHTDYYQKILLPMRSHYTIGSVLCRDGIHESAFAITRGADHKPYANDEVEFIRIITPHLSRAIHIYKELQTYKSYTSIAKSILDQDSKVLLVCNEIGEILICNQTAKDKLSDNQIIQIQNNRLCSKNRKLQTSLYNQIYECSNMALKNISDQKTIYFQNPINDIDSLLIKVSALGSQSYKEFKTRCCLVTIEINRQLNWGNIKNTFELTRREFELLQALHANQKLHQLTDVFHVSYNTLRTHLQSIFRKTEVNSQAELMIKINLFRQ